MAPSLPPPLERDELDWAGVLAALTELIGLPCTARTYATARAAPLITISGRFERTFEPFDLDGGPLFLMLGDGLLSLEEREFAGGRLERGTLPHAPGSVAVVEIVVRGGSLIELEAHLTA